MNPFNNTTNQTKQLLDAQTHIWNHIFAYHNSMALKCAIELGIPDAIHKHGNPLSLSDLIHCLAIHPSKASSLYRLMRLLSHSNFFVLDESNIGDPIFGLNTNSELLLKNHPLSLASFAISTLQPTMTNPACHFSLWFKNDVESPFHIDHGRSFWEHASFMGSLNEYFNESMATDARFITSLISTSSCAKHLFDGIKSLVDVGGGDGTMAEGIVKANPTLKCIVLDLPHVVEGLRKGEDKKITYLGGNMFEAIPRANAVLLKWILHDWSDEHCIKILENCREAIPNKKQGGKVIIIDMVVGNKSYSQEYRSAQYLIDMQMMSLTIGGKERNEEEWKKLFIQSGFNDYKMLHVLGPRSIIEVYPF